MRIRLKEFDASAYLDDEEVIAEFLTAALEDGDPEIFLSAASHQICIRKFAACLAGRSTPLLGGTGNARR